MVTNDFVVKNDLYRFGQAMKTWRLGRKMTMEDVSRRSGVNISTISRLENGKCCPSYFHVRAIVRALGGSVELRHGE